MHAPDQKTHDARLSAVLARLKEKGVTLNKEKCSFSQPRLKFLGHMVDEHGVSADPEKTAAVSEMSPPRNTTELRRFLGLANQLGKFSPNLAELSQPLRELLKKDRAWFWGPTAKPLRLHGFYRLPYNSSGTVANGILSDYGLHGHR